VELDEQQVKLGDEGVLVVAVVADERPLLSGIRSFRGKSC
jgi:hypothetical protein